MAVRSLRRRPREEVARIGVPEPELSREAGILRSFSNIDALRPDPADGDGSTTRRALEAACGTSNAVDPRRADSIRPRPPLPSAISGCHERPSTRQPSARYRLRILARSSATATSSWSDGVRWPDRLRRSTSSHHTTTARLWCTGSVRRSNGTTSIRETLQTDPAAPTRVGNGTVPSAERRQYPAFEASRARPRPVAFRSETPAGGWR
jgi:hypothetical protein